MADVILGCDTNKPSEDRKTLKTVAKILEKAGHKVDILSVGPNYVQSAMQQKQNKGKIAVYLVNGADLQTYKDIGTGIGRYYNAKYCYFGLQGWISPSTCSCKGAKTAKLKKAKDDASSVSYTAELVGMTTEQVMEKYKKTIAYACGSSVKELADNLVTVMGGGSNSSSSKSKESTGTTIKEALKKAVSVKWDGEAEINLRGDTVYVNKIKDPTSTKLVINEYDNVIYDSISATDVNPKTINTLIMTFKDYELKLTDDSLIKRFGIVKKTIKAPKSIKKLKDAKAYLNREWNKLRRDNGRQVELKVPGSTKWKTGKWARTYLPSVFIDDYMYITKASGDEDGTNNWTVSLTLVDYPPSFGKFEEDKLDKDEDKDKDKDDKDKDDKKEDNKKGSS